MRKKEGKGVTRQEMAVLPLEQLRAHLAALQERKRANAKRLGWVESDGGKWWMAEKQEQLRKVREEYPAIVVNDERSAEAILRELVAVQCKDRQIAEEIRALEGAKIVEKKVDDELSVCHSVLSERANTARTER